jgi:putative spermidine/putrescine transport system substrate-binding protein
MGGSRIFTQRTAQQFLRSSMIDRRGFLAGTAALAGATLLPTGGAFAQADGIPEFSGFPERLKGTGQLRLATAGGALAEAEHKAFIDYFKEHSGIEVIETEGFSTAQIKAQVDTQSVQWDVVGLGRGNILPLVKQGTYFEDIDYSVVDWAGVEETDRKKESVAFFTLGTVMCYRTDAFQEQPSSWADFFDTARFPGPRNWMSGSMGIAPQLEGALIADGVPMDQLYPLDIDRALKSLDRIKDDISVFWSSGAQSAQLMAENETVLGTAWNGRVSPLVADGLPVAISWSGAMFEQEHLVAIKGTPNYENAMKFIAFALSPEAQARFSMFIPYGYVNTEAAALVPEARKAILPSAHLSEGFWNNPEWWGENRDKAIEMWAEWMLT